MDHRSLPPLTQLDLELLGDYQTQLYLAYARELSEPRGQEVVTRLSNDTRVKALQGKMLSLGSFGQGFDVNSLAMWFLWFSGEQGEQRAELALETFLNTGERPALATLWVLGIELEEKVDLSGGYCIQPIADMPETRDKQYFLRKNYFATTPALPSPFAAITKLVSVPTSRAPDDLGGNEDFFESTRRLHTIALSLNLLDGVSCVPYYSTAYSPPEVPIGPFFGSGGGSFSHDVLGVGTTKLSHERAVEIDELCSKLQLSENRKRMELILSRLSQSKRRSQIEDKILDLGIALEMLLLDDNVSNEQLSLTFRLRGSWLVGEDASHRANNFATLRDLYKYRSQVAHSGVLCKGNASKIQVVREEYPKFVALAEQIGRTILTNGTPDWDRLILG